MLGQEQNSKFYRKIVSITLKILFGMLCSHGFQNNVNLCHELKSFLYFCLLNIKNTQMHLNSFLSYYKNICLKHFQCIKSGNTRPEQYQRML